MKKFWISCALALMLAALVVFGFLPTPGHAESGAKAENSSESSEGKSKNNGFTYVHMDPIVLPIIGADGAEQLVTLLIDLQVKDTSVSEKVRVNMPRVQDSILQELYGGFADGSLRDGDRVKIAEIKGKVAGAIDKILGPHAVDDVLIQGVAQRML